MRYRTFLASVVFGAAVVAAASSAAETIQDIVDQVSQASYTDYLDNWLYTHDGDNRGIGGAHYDSVNNPGADDNGSGVAGVLEAARVLSQYSFEATLIFMAFDREEQGLVGSRAYAAAHSEDDIRGMISLDMIAYNPVGPTEDMARIYYDTHLPIPQITSDLADAMAEYSGLSTTIAPGGDVSDHAPFAHVGFESALLIEYNVWSNPNYHKLTDSVDTAGYIDYQYATQMTRGTVGYLATAAQHVPEPEIPTLLGTGLLVVALIVRRRPALARGPALAG